MTIETFREYLSDFGSMLGNEFRFKIEGGLLEIVRAGGQPEVYEMISSGSVDLKAIQNESGSWSPQDFISRKAANLESLAKKIISVSKTQDSFLAVPTNFILPEIEFTDGISLLEEYKGIETVSKVSELLSKRTPNTTLVYYLTSDAGEGKTVLMNYLAYKFASEYLAGASEAKKLLFPIPLGGRIVANIDDMVAAVTMNKYAFPIMPAHFYKLVKLGAIVPAFDGLEELFLSDIDKDSARTTVSSLIKSLGGEGVVLIAARKTFHGVRGVKNREAVIDDVREWDISFLDFELKKWSQQMFQEYATKKGLSVADSVNIYSGLNQLIPGNNWYQRAYYVARIVDLALGFKQDLGEKKDWVNTFLETFKNKHVTDFIEALALSINRREVKKWLHQDGDSGAPRPILTEAEHEELLSEVAVEMWRNRTEELSIETLELVGDVFAAKIRNPIMGAQAKTRLPQHGLLVRGNSSRTVKFDHEAIFYYFLGHSLLLRLIKKESIDDLIAERDLNELIVGAAVRKILRLSIDERKTIIEQLLKYASSAKQGTYAIGNISKILLPCLSNRACDGVALTLKGLSFPQDSLHSCAFADIKFQNCYFARTGIGTKTRMQKCAFVNCTFEGIMLEQEHASISDVTIDEDSQVCGFVNLIGDEYYVPGQISVLLEKVGIKRASANQEKDNKLIDPEPEMKVLSKLIKYFELRTTLCVDVVETKLGGAGFSLFNKMLPELKRTLVLLEDPKHPKTYPHYKLGSKLADIQSNIRASRGEYREFLHLMGTVEKKGG